MMPLQSAQVIAPLFIRLLHNLGVRQLKNNVFEVLRKRAAQQSFDVFDKYGLGLKLPNSTKYLWEHVALVTVSAMLSGQ